MPSSAFPARHTFQQLLQRQAQYVRQSGMVQIQYIARWCGWERWTICPGTPTTTELAGRINHHCVGADTAVLADGDGASTLHPCLSPPVSDGRMRLPFSSWSRPGSRRGIKSHPPRSQPFPDHNTHAMINEKTGTIVAPGWISTPVKLRATCESQRPRNLKLCIHSQWVMRCARWHAAPNRPEKLPAGARRGSRSTTESRSLRMDAKKPTRLGVGSIRGQS